MISMGHGEPAMMPVRSETQIELGKYRVLQLGDEHGGNAMQGGATLLRNRLQGGIGIEKRSGDDHGGARHHASHVAQHYSEAVIERHRNAQPVVMGEAHRVGHSIALFTML